MLNAIGVQGLLPKAFISMYPGFFPMVVGMVKKLTSLLAGALVGRTGRWIDRRMGLGPGGR